MEKMAQKEHLKQNKHIHDNQTHVNNIKIKSRTKYQFSFS